MGNTRNVNDEWICDAVMLAMKSGGEEVLHRSLYHRLRELIESGQLMQGVRLPSSRRLAQVLGIARNTALSALEQLAHEGFIETRQGAGSFVAEGQFSRNVAATRTESESSVLHDDSPFSLRGEALLAFTQRSHSTSLAFTTGLPAMSLFPWEHWRRIQQKHLRRAHIEWMGYQGQGGLLHLREVLCEYLTLSRSVCCTPERIVITQGAQQAFMLIAQLLAEAGESVWFENPGYLGARAAFSTAGLKLIPMEVDSGGMVPDDTHPVPRLIYITPSYQFPCAVTLSLARRLYLLGYAERTGAWIIEDDYDSEFRYDAQPLASLQGLGNGERVIYVGTFSKVMYPGLGLGYMVLPPALVKPFRALSIRLARESHYPLQAAVADFIADGAFRRHIRRCRKAYGERQATLREALAPAVKRGLEVSTGQAGMHLMVTHPDGIDETALQRLGLAHGINLPLLSPHYLGKHHRTGLILGYAAVEPDDIFHMGGLLEQWLKQTGS